MSARSRLFLERHLINFIVLSAVLFSLGCATSKSSGGYEDRGLVIPHSDRPHRSSKEVTRFMPWEVWPLGSDLQGNPIRSGLIKHGDAAIRSGQRAKAIEHYYQAQNGPLAPGENEALVMRIASTELALDQPNKALATLSNYFRSAGKVVDDVNASFSLTFAYAYARKGDLPQSLAWFARAAQIAGGRDAGLRGSAEEGMRSVLRSLSDVALDGVTQQWSNEPVVRSLAGEERSRRFAGGAIDSAGLWAGSPADVAGEYVPGTISAGVLLPLTGHFASLGKSVKNGMELALSGLHQAQSGAAALKLSYRDASGGADDALTQARQLVAADGVNMIIGPLLSEHAAAVGDFARSSRLPLLALAKNTNFATGETVFRLGATAESQVRSLMEASQNKLRLQRFALVYPDDANGQEFADLFRREIAARGLQLLYESSYPKGNHDIFVSIAPALEASGVEAVFLPDSVTMAARFFGTLSQGFRERIRPLGVAMWDSPTQLANSSAALEGAVFVSPFLAVSPRPAVSQFLESYRASFGTAPDFLAAQGFDALTLVAAAARRQQADGGPITLALQQLDVYDGLTGRITVRPDGELERQFSVAELTHGKIQEVPEVETPMFVIDGGGNQG